MNRLSTRLDRLEDEYPPARVPGVVLMGDESDTEETIFARYELKHGKIHPDAQRLFIQLVPLTAST